MTELSPIILSKKHKFSFLLCFRHRATGICNKKSNISEIWSSTPELIREIVRLTAISPLSSAEVAQSDKGKLYIN